MRMTANPGVPARSSLLLGVVCVLALALAASLSAVASGSLSQAVITYGYLRSNHADFDQLLASGPTLAVARDMKALEGALDSLRCDVPTLLAFPHRALVVPSSPVGQWIGFPTTEESPPEEGTLFVTQPLRAPPQRVWVVLSSVAPERTTVFWLEEGERGYVSGLVYDSFNKGKISNAPHTMIGAVTEVNLGKGDKILLKEWAEPGSRPGQMGAVGRVFQVDLARGEVTLKTPGRCHDTKAPSEFQHDPPSTSCLTERLLSASLKPC